MSATYVDEYTRKFTLTPADSALLIVDMQYASGSREHGLGKVLRAQGRLEEAEDRFSRIDDVLIPNIRRLLDGFRTASAPVVHIMLGPAKADYSDAPRHLRAWFEATNNHVGTREHEIVDELKPIDGELIVRKTTMGAFSSTGIDTHLKAMGIESVVVVGVSTNNCVGMTAFEASDLQYGVVLVSDATGTCSEEMQQASLKTFRRLWGRVMSVDEVLGELNSTVSSATST